MGIFNKSTLKMNRLFKTFMCVAILSIVYADSYSRSDTNRESAQVENRSISLNMNTARNTYDKFNTLTNTSTSYQKPLSLYENLYEVILGKSLEKLDFESSVTNFLDRTRVHNKRLGQSSTVTSI